MHHYILVRFNDQVSGREALCTEISALFSKALLLPGIKDVCLRPAIIESPGRYDLMIDMQMHRDALPVFDASPIHREWKERFARFIDAKAIFDCE